jgi:hypothetical protein
MTTPSQAAMMKVHAVSELDERVVRRARKRAIQAADEGMSQDQAYLHVRTFSEEA